MNKGLMVRIGLVAVLIAVIIIGYNGCGGGGGSSSGSSSVAKLVLTGKIGAGYQASYTPPERFFDRFIPSFVNNAMAIAGITVDKIIAMPYDSGYLGEYCILEAKEAVINSLDGTFSLSLEKNRNWLLILVNTAAIGRDKFVGYIALKMDADNSMLLTPVSSATTSTLDLGTIDQSADPDVAMTQDVVTTTAFSLNQSQLLDLAKNDDLLKIVKNLYFNYQSGIYWNLRPDYNWGGDYSAINGTFSNPSAFTFSGGYSFQLDSNFHGITVQQFIGPPTGSPKALLEVYPPSSVEAKDSGFIYDASTPISNLNNTTGGLTQSGDWEAWSGNFFAGERYGNISYSLTAFTGTIPAGFWKLGITSTPSTALANAEFDVAVASPISGTVIKGFVPSIKVNVDGSKRITSVDIKWYVWNGATYEEVIDQNALKSLVGRFDFGFDNTTAPNPRSYESGGHDVSVTNIVPQGTWYYGDYGTVTETQRAESILVFYSCGGVGYFFFWNNWHF